MTVAHLFDERNVAVKRMVQLAIAAAKKCERKIGICGQASSDYPEFAQFLVKQSIDSISLNPDSVLKTLLIVVEVDKSQSLIITVALTPATLINRQFGNFP